MLAASDEILDECIACGGSVTGEHGIGVEKISFMRKLFNDDDLAAMSNLRDAFNPHGQPEPRQDAADRRRLRHGAKTPGAAGGTVITMNTKPLKLRVPPPDPRHPEHEAYLKWLRNLTIEERSRMIKEACRKVWEEELARRNSGFHDRTRAVSSIHHGVL